MSTTTWSTRTTSIALLLSLLTNLAAATSPVTPAHAAPLPDRPPRASAWLRLDQVAYRAGDCVRAELHAPGVASATLKLATRDAGDQQSVSLVPALPGVFVSACVPTQAAAARAADGVLQVNPGDVVIALGTGPDARPLALDTAVVRGGHATGRYSTVLDPSIRTEPGQSALRDPDGDTALFASNQLIVREARPGDLAALLARRGGTDLGSFSVPTVDGPAGVPAVYHLVQIDPSRQTADDLDVVAERFTGAAGTYRYSSLDTERLVATVLEERAGGSSVYPNQLLTPSAVPVSNEGIDTNGGGSVALDHFASTFYNPLDSTHPGVRAGEAAAMLAVIDQPAKLQISTAIIDGGFASPTDWSGFASPDYGQAFNAVPQCDVSQAPSVCLPSSAVGPNPGTCTGGAPCPWHGTQMFSVAAARLDNGYGAAGIGSGVVAPMFLKTSLSIFSTANGISTAVNRGARVINMSFGSSCKPFLGLDLCDGVWRTLVKLAMATPICEFVFTAYPELALLQTCAAVYALLDWLDDMPALDAAVVAADAAQVVMVASAGNDSRDAEASKEAPCVLGNVVCVGALDANLAKRSTSNYGRVVNVWAPGTNLTAMPTPASDPTGLLNHPSIVSGTSPAAAFVSGLAADILSINPSLTAAGVRDILFKSACRTTQPARDDGSNCTPSSDSKVDLAAYNGGGYVDALDALQRARRAAFRPTLAPCTGGWDVDERPGSTHDTAATALPVGPVRAVTNATLDYTGAGDLSIHAFRPGNASDEDWYELSFRRLTSDHLMYYVDVTLDMADLIAGSLGLDVFRKVGPGLYVPIAVIDAKASDLSSTANVFAILNTAETYYVRVMAMLPPIENDNCYRSLHVEVGDPAPDPCSSPFGCMPGRFPPPPIQRRP